MSDDLETERLKRLGMQLAIDCAGDDIPPTSAEMLKRRRKDKREAQREVDDYLRVENRLQFNGQLWQREAGRAE